jgi:hypothetical protein
LASLVVFPEKVTLVGADRTQQLVITGRYPSGEECDVTAQVVLRSADSQIVRVADGERLVPVRNGSTEVLCELSGKSATVTVTVRGLEHDQPINFTNEVVPILSKLGCNGGGCHGKSGGQNGFALSLMGFVPEMDYQALVNEGRGRRLFPAAPEHSLLLRKATGATGHGGGKRLATDAPEYKLLVRWIGSGMPFGSSKDRKITRISVIPEQRLLRRQSRQQLAVTAQYSDGSQEDVTARAEYTSNADELLAISAAGLITTADKPGAGAVMIRYLGQVAVFQATIPTGASLDGYPQHPPNSFVDRHVFARHRQLGIPASDLCTDAEFIRRVSIDVTGTLPTPVEVEKFLADPRPNKREQLIDDLLTRPAYANYFALKWGDILRNRLGENYNDPYTALRTTGFHAWIRDSIAANKPYDQFVRELLTARGNIVDTDAQPPVAWYTFLNTPQLLVDDTAQVFLGTQLQCAQCHHHPYEKWSQDDYWGLAAFFGRLQWASADPKKKGNFANLSQKIEVLPKGRVQSPKPYSKTYTSPKPLDGAELAIPPEEDPRQKLTDWLVHEPLFARAVVNRYWAHFLGRGLVDPVDDMRVTNPPTNPELLEALAQDFVAHRFDLTHLVRVICGSKTYQLSSVANPLNRDDMQNYSRHIPRRLLAEVLLDAVDQVNGTRTQFELGLIRKQIVGAAEYEKYEQLRDKLRAIELPDEGLFRTPLLKVFEKPNRETASECERGTTPSLGQTLFLLNDKGVQDKIAGDASRAARLAADPRADADKIKELYLWCYARAPSARELKVVEDYLAPRRAPQAKRQAYEDIIWSLINTKEFLFNL